jgi:type I restriction enzyme S subunit
MQNLNQGILLDLRIGVPPLAEQHRIVAKVDELITLCDRLESSVLSGDETRRRLLEALLREALDKPVERAA